MLNSEQLPSSSSVYEVIGCTATSGKKGVVLPQSGLYSSVIGRSAQDSYNSRLNEFRCIKPACRECTRQLQQQVEQIRMYQAYREGNLANFFCCHCMGSFMVRTEDKSDDSGVVAVLSMGSA